MGRHCFKHRRGYWNWLCRSREQRQRLWHCRCMLNRAETCQTTWKGSLGISKVVGRQYHSKFTQVVWQQLVAVGSRLVSRRSIIVTISQVLTRSGERIEPSQLSWSRISSVYQSLESQRPNEFKSQRHRDK